MKSVKVILFLITVVTAQHNISHRNNISASEVNFFNKINEDIHNITKTIFVTLLNHRYAESPKDKLYLSMHNYSNSMAKKNYEMYMEMKEISKPAVDNTIIKKFFSITEVIKEILFKEIYGEPNIQIDDNITSDFENSLELADFVRKFETKIKTLSVDDLFKQPPNDTNRKESDSSARNLEAWRPKEFLHNGTRRLYRGMKSKITRYPFLASVHILGELMCAGSIISTDLVITAASCLQIIYNNKLFRENPKSVTVRVGSSYATRSGDLIAAAAVHFYPAYNPKNLFNNLAIIRMARHIRFSSRSNRVKKILMDKHEGIMPSNTPSVLVLGWGAKDKKNIVGLLPKMSISALDVYHLEECKDVYSRFYVTNKHFCAGFVSKGGGACNKDAGGPGVVGGILAGVISFGPPACGTVDAPTVFTKVGYYVDWIEEIMEQPRVRYQARTTLKTRPPLIQQQVTTNIPTRGPVRPIGLRNGPNRSSVENILLKEILNEVIFSETDVLKELMHEAPNWGDDDINDIFTPEAPAKVLSPTVLPDDYILYGPMDEGDILKPTVKTLIKKSLVPKKYSTYHTTTINPLALRTQLDVEKNPDSESFGNYEDPDSGDGDLNPNDRLDAGNGEDTKNQDRNSALRQNLDKEKHITLNNNLKNTTPLPNEDANEENENDEDIDEENENEDDGYDSLEDILFYEQYQNMDPQLYVEYDDSENTDEEDGTEKNNYEPNYYGWVPKNEFTTLVENKKTNANYKSYHESFTKNVYGDKNKEIVTVLKSTVPIRTDVPHRTTDVYRNSRSVKKYNKKYKKLAPNLENTTPVASQGTDKDLGTNDRNHQSLREGVKHEDNTKINTNIKNKLYVESESTDEEQAMKKNSYKSLKEDSYEQYKQKYVKLKNKVLFPSGTKNGEHGNNNIMDHEPVIEDMDHVNNKMDTKLKNKVLLESARYDEQHIKVTKNMDHKSLKQDIYRDKVKKNNPNLKNKVLFESARYDEQDVVTKNMDDKSLKLDIYRNKVENTYPNLKNKVLFASDYNDEKHATKNMNHETLREIKNQGDNDFDAGLKNKILSNDRPNAQAPFISDHGSNEISKFLSNAYSVLKIDKNNLVSETTNRVDHGHRMGRTMIFKELDNFEP